MERREYEDAFIPAFFLATKKSFKVVPRRDTGNRVTFIVEGDGSEIDNALNELYENRLVPALGLIREVKTLRSAIFALRRGVRR